MGQWEPMVSGCMSISRSLDHLFIITGGKAERVGRSMEMGGRSARESSLLMPFIFSAAKHHDHVGAMNV